MKTRIDLSDSPYINFAKILAAYLFAGASILCFILAFAGYGTEKFDSSKLEVGNILQMLSIIFGILTAFFALVLTLAFTFSQVFKQIASRMGWPAGASEVSFIQYWQNLIAIVSAAAIALGLLAGFLHSL